MNVARLNGFILTGKTGGGKSTLLNVIFDQQFAEAKKDAFAELKNAKFIILN